MKILPTLSILATTAPLILSANYFTDFENFALDSDTDPATPLFVDPALGANNWKGNGFTGYDAEIEDVGGSNGKVLRMSNAAVSGNFDSIHPTTPFLDEPIGQAGSGGSEGVFSFSLDFSSVSTSEQPGLAVDISPLRSGTSSRQGILRIEDRGDLVGGLSVSWIDYFGVQFFETDIATGLDRNSWHTIEGDVTLIDGPDNDLFEISINSTPFTTFELVTWEGFYANNSLDPVAVDSLIFRVANPLAGEPSVDGAGLYFDNLNLSGTLIPEPSTFGILMLSALTLFLRRRKTP